MQIESSPAEHHPNGGIDAQVPHATLTLSAEPEGVSMLVDHLCEDIAPRENGGKVFKMRAVEHMDHTDEFHLNDLDDPPVCDLGPNLLKCDL